MGLEIGCIQVYTGEGKGKTTAALGLAVRAVGHGLKVVVIQFLKGEGPSGERAAAERLWPLLVIKPMGRPGFVNRSAPAKEDCRLAERALEEARRLMESGSCDVLILDEINVAVASGLIAEQAALDLLEIKPRNMELILTGRHAPEAVIRRADLVTTMRATKHYYDHGQVARAGIEF